ETSRSSASFPPWTNDPFERGAGAVEPRSRSEVFSSAWFGGVQWPMTRDASGESSITLSPKSVRPSYGALPVATKRFPVDGSTTAPERAQIAESLERHVDGRMTPRRFAHSEFQTWTMRPFLPSSVTTCPWYGGASPM